MKKHTSGNWQAFNMVHADRGDAMTPEEIGEYVKNSVLKSIEDGGSADRFLFVSSGGPDARDICLVGNGPDGPANAALIAAAPHLLSILSELDGSFEQQVYQERAREDFDAPDDREYCVNITAKQLRAISALIAKVE